MFERKLCGLVALALCLAALSPPVWAQTTQDLVNITPCRLVDTRNDPGAFGGPALVAGATRTIPVLSGSCNLPANATAYAFNVTVVPLGSLIFLTMWPSGIDRPNASTLNSPTAQIIANAAIIPAGVNGSVDVYASYATQLIIDVNGYFVPTAAPPTPPVIPNLADAGIAAGVQNTAIGSNTLAFNTGTLNTALGAYVLAANSTGNNNVGVGADVLMANTSGTSNTAVGGEALTNNLVGNADTAIGFSALWTNNVGLSNTAVGVSALYNNAAGSYNVAIGQSSLFTSTGSNNVAIGYQAGAQTTNGNYNIFISNEGQAADNAVIRIGADPVQTRTFIAGIYDSTVSGAAVLINSNGQLGVATSSRRFKEDIQPIGNTSDALMQLRPVQFRYKQAAPDGTKPLEYGLIGEEVAKIYPELVLYGRDGKVESLKYQELPALLLNELQKQHKVIEELEARIAALESQLRAQQTAK